VLGAAAREEHALLGHAGTIDGDRRLAGAKEARQALGEVADGQDQGMG
jgi:hypothetical protein